MGFVARPNSERINPVLNGGDLSFIGRDVGADRVQQTATDDGPTVAAAGSDDVDVEIRIKRGILQDNLSSLLPV